LEGIGRNSFATFGFTKRDYVFEAPKEASFEDIYKDDEAYEMPLLKDRWVPGKTVDDLEADGYYVANRKEYL